MCGIAGIYGSLSRGERQSAEEILSGNLAHRGPDGHGLYEHDLVSLVHRRLSIIDLSEKGSQPLYNEDRSLALVCNGEIYNYLQVRAELIAKGHTFYSNSDSEVILHLYEEHHNDLKQLLSRLTGMFAFALWDEKRKKLFVARDRVGIKPLYYSWDNGSLIFASEVKPIASCGLVSAEMDYTSLYEYFLTGSIPGPNTLYKGIKCVDAGHYLVVESGKLGIHEYWDIPQSIRKWTSEQEALAAVDTLLSQVIKDHLVADVPVGTFLSAGVDSSLITAMAVGFHPGIHSFTASFPGEPEDEGAIAKDTAEKLHTTHHAYELKTNFFADFGKQFRDLDQPFAVSSALSLGRISKLARQQVKVVLSGDGGDELFGGYNRHEFPKQPAFLNMIPTGMQDSLLRLGAKVTGKSSLEKLRVSLQKTDGRKFLDRVRIADEQAVLALFAPEVAKQIDQERFLRRLDAYFDKRKGDDSLNRVLYVDMKTTLIDEMLTKCDRMTMINGIEGCVPFLDHRMVELAFSIPAGYKRRDGVGKIVLRELLAKRLGHDLAYRKKTGFNAPLQQWLANDKDTAGFIKNELQQSSHLDFYNHAITRQYAENPGGFGLTTVFSLVCLNYFLLGELVK
jgi:asparagine synthase (glutamine-hydrolysing)